jgi:hypothetical protein
MIQFKFELYLNTFELRDHGYYQPAALITAVIGGSTSQPLDPSCHPITACYDLANNALRSGGAADPIHLIAAIAIAVIGGYSGCQGSRREC